MNLRTSYSGVPESDAVRADLTRIEDVWAFARAHAADGPWLLGAYSLADAFFAPVAMRIAGYGLSVNALARTYVNQHLADRHLRAWRARGLQDAPQEFYIRDYQHVDWPASI